jgi:excisionase family DNA binding protein
VSPAASLSRPAPPRLALTPEEAAASIGISRDSFDRHVLPEIRAVRRGRLVLVPVKELEKWVDRSASLALGADVR